MNLNEFWLKNVGDRSIFKSSMLSLIWFCIISIFLFISSSSSSSSFLTIFWTSFIISFPAFSSLCIGMWSKLYFDNYICSISSNNFIFMSSFNKTSFTIFFIFSSLILFSLSPINSSYLFNKSLYLPPSISILSSISFFCCLYSLFFNSTIQVLVFFH